MTPDAAPNSAVKSEAKNPTTSGATTRTSPATEYTLLALDSSTTSASASAIMAGPTVDVPAEVPVATKPADGATNGEVGATNGEVGAAEASAAAPVFDLTTMSKKKKKKKPKTGAADGDESALAAGLAAATLSTNAGNDPEGMGLGEGMENGAEPISELEAADFPLPDFTGKKKRMKKKVFFENDLDDAAGDGEGGDRVSRRAVVDQPWDGTDRDYTYSELINRAFQFLHGKNPALAAGTTGRKKIVLQLPQVAREGTKKTVFLNFGAICKSIHRQQDHLLAYMGAELGTTGNMQDGGRLVVKGRFSAEAIGKVLMRYMKEYVVCTSCRSPDTVLMRDANTRLYFVSCESCGAKRSVTPIKQGFMAQVGRRKR